MFDDNRETKTKMNKTKELRKRARCFRCGYEASVKYDDRYKKACPKCFEGESILELMRLVPAHFIDPETVASIESDYQDWVN